MRGWRLTLEQINAARRLRFDSHMSWRNIGRELGCDAETVQRTIDPQYDHHKRAVYARRKVEIAKAREAARERKERWRRKRAESPVVGPIRSDDNENHHEFILRRQTLRSDTAFSRAMTAAIRNKQESASIGIDNRPSSPDARYCPARGLTLSSASVTGSSAGMCAES